MDGVTPHPESFPPYRGEPVPYPDQPPPYYPGALPPPMPYPPPKPRRRNRIVLIAAAALLVVAIAGGVLYAVLDSQRGLSKAEATSTIQGYLNALLHQDKKTVARHALCGLYDGVKDHSGDLTVANLASDAFRRQFSAAQVTSIDKIVMLSPTQAQVLFTMKVTPAARPLRATPTTSEVQAVAQLLIQPGDSLVCSYLPRPLDSE